MQQGRAQLAATVCVEQFMAAPDAQAKLASLKAADSWKRQSFVSDGGWATMPGMTEPVSYAAEACAERLGKMEAPPRKAAQG
jgi:hypothetical protein